MRLSADRDHPWYSPASICAEVFIDGKAVKNCTRASERQKIAVLAEFYFDPDLDAVGIRETSCFCQVEIRVPAHAQHFLSAVNFETLDEEETYAA